MDYSYFSAAPQPYQLFALPPTPATRNSPPQADEFPTTLNSYVRPQAPVS